MMNATFNDESSITRESERLVHIIYLQQTMMMMNRRIALTTIFIAIAGWSAKRAIVVNSFQPSGIISPSSVVSSPALINTHLFESTSSSSETETVDPIISSAASQWMAKELQIEKEMDQVAQTATAVITDELEAAAVANENEIEAAGATDDKTPHNNNNNNNNNNERWEELHGNYILRPQQQQPRALIHFLGGALLGAAPQLTYRYLLERLSSRGYLIVATPYQLSFDHLTTCDEIIDRFELVAPELARGEYTEFVCLFMYICHVFSCVWA